MVVRVRLRRINKPKNSRLRFDLEILKDATISEEFQAAIGGNMGYRGLWIEVVPLMSGMLLPTW